LSENGSQRLAAKTRASLNWYIFSNYQKKFQTEVAPPLPAKPGSGFSGLLAVDSSRIIYTEINNLHLGYVD
jgi:hypothetical protein